MGVRSGEGALPPPQQINIVADFFREKLNFIGTNRDIAFLYHPLGDLGVTYTVHLWLVGKRVVDFL